MTFTFFFFHVHKRWHNLMTHLLNCFFFLSLLQIDNLIYFPPKIVSKSPLTSPEVARTHYFNGNVRPGMEGLRSMSNAASAVHYSFTVIAFQEQLSSTAGMHRRPPWTSWWDNGGEKWASVVATSHGNSVMGHRKPWPAYWYLLPFSSFH